MKLEVQLEHEGDSKMFEDLERYLKYHPNLTRFLFNPAGFTFLIGWFLFFGMSLGLIAIFVINATVAGKILEVALLEITAGREVAIPAGIGLGVPVLVVWGISFTQDLITTAWIYPAFYLFRSRNVGKENFAGYFFQKMEKNAEKNKEFVEKYGAVGLFFFMLIPFAVNGPLIGAVIGKLAGIRTRYILPTVIMATFTATTAWTLAWYFADDAVQRFVDRFGGHWIALGMVAILLVVVGATILGFLRDIRHFRIIRARREELVRRAQVSETLYAEGESPRSPEVHPPQK